MARFKQATNHGLSLAILAHLDLDADQVPYALLVAFDGKSDEDF